MMAMASERPRGTGKGEIFPHEKAWMLLNPLRRLVQRPSNLVSQLNLSSDARMLELGPGPGYFSAEISKRVADGDVHLFDIQPEILRMALRRVYRSGLRNVAAIQGDALSLPFRGACFDAAFLASVLGEVPDPLQCLRELHRVLKPRALLLVTETHGDPDRIPPERLAELAAGAQFAVEGRRGRGWVYAMTFRVTNGQGA